MRKSQNAAISSPPPTQMPWICAISGWRQSASACAVVCMTLPYSIACALFARAVANSPMSFPGENALSPAPRRITQRTPSSSDSAPIVSPRACHIAWVSALSFSGRLRTTVAIGPSRATAINASICEVSSGLDRAPEASPSIQDPADQWPQQQDECERRDRADESIRPKNAHIAARPDHRQAKRVLGSIAEQQREGGWRERK